MSDRQTAKQNGDRFYHGSACKKCGNTYRYTSSADCVDCRLSNNATNKEKISEAHSAWKLKNPDKMKESCRRWRNRNPIRNRVSVSTSQCKGIANCPKWLTDDHKAIIRAIYALSKIKSVLTGVNYSVDHIVPIRGKNVCGLHVPWNLQIITCIENSRKSNIF